MVINKENWLSPRDWLLVNEISPFYYCVRRIWAKNDKGRDVPSVTIPSTAIPIFSVDLKIVSFSQIDKIITQCRLVSEKIVGNRLFIISIVFARSFMKICSIAAWWRSINCASETSLLTRGEECCFETKHDNNSFSFFIVP